MIDDSVNFAKANGAHAEAKSAPAPGALPDAAYGVAPPANNAQPPSAGKAPAARGWSLTTASAADLFNDSAE